MSGVELSVTAARARVEAIRSNVEDIKTLIVEAYQQRDWEALGYAGWDEYCTAEFGGAIAIPREERGDVVFTLREAGLSTRAIAAATGLSKGTVGNTLKPGAQDWAPAPEPLVQGDPEPAAEPETAWLHDPVADVGDDWGDDPDNEVVEAEIVPDPEPATVTGIDGKRYQASRPSPPSSPRRRPWAEAYSDAVTAIERATTTLQNLAQDDRAGKHSEQAIGRTNDLLRAIDALTDVANQLR